MSLNRMMARLALATLSGVLVCLSGCAVLRVDVDVYKGPLADEEHVQVQRLAVMAIAAKPLLVEARNLYAGEDLLGKYQLKNQSRQEPFDYSGDSDQILEAWHRRPRARLINDILRLYKNREIGAEELIFRMHVDQVQAAAKQLDAAWTDLYAIDGVPPSVRRKSNDQLTSVQAAEYWSTLSEATIEELGDTWKPQRQIAREIYPLAQERAKDLVNAILDALAQMEQVEALTATQAKRRIALIEMLLPILEVGHASELLRFQTALATSACAAPPFPDPRPQSHNGESFRTLTQALYCTPASAAKALRASGGAGVLARPQAEGFRAASTQLSNLRRQLEVRAGGLEEGRIEDGLVVLTERFLETQHRESLHSAVLEQRQLTEALIRFAHKLVYLSNNQMFVDGQGSDVAECGDDDGNSLKGQSSSPRMSPEQNRARCKELLTIIEVVGNSILIQANELHARAAHHDAMASRYPARRQSILAHFGGDSASIVARALETIEQRRAETRAASDHLAALRAQRQTAEQGAKQRAQAQKDAQDARAKKKADLDAKQPASAALGLALTGLKQPGFAACVNAARTATPAPSEQALFAKLTGCAQQAESAAVSTNAAEDLKALRALLAALAAYKDEQRLGAFESKLSADRVVADNATAAARQALELAEAAWQKAKAEAEADTALAASKVAEAALAAHELEKAAVLADIERYSAESIDLLRTTASTALATDPPLQAAAVRQAWMAAVQASADKHRQSALEVLAATSMPLPMPDALLPDNASSCVSNGCERDDQGCSLASCATPELAMDALIAWLQGHRARIAQDQGVDSIAYRSASQALADTYLDRAGLSYIRPAAYYLRSSFTASSLQEGESGGWDNMLDNTYQRSVPWLGQRYLEANPRAEVLQRLDAQYWQNINNIRVAGGGRSNYVLIKDDVGNWTVRSYSTDYDETLKSLKNMALFNYGEKLGAELVNSDFSLKKPADTRFTPESSGLGGLFASYRKSFDDSRLAAQSALKTALTSPNLRQQVTAAWGQHEKVKDSARLPALKERLEQDFVATLKATTDALERAQTESNFDLIYDALRSLRAFKKAVSASIEAVVRAPANAEHASAAQALNAANSLPVDQADRAAAIQAATATLQTASEAQAAANETASAALAAANGLVDPLIAKIKADRASAIKQFETALTFIGEAANREPETKP
ncbi:hypothetical protein [Pseudomarimonas arenosa]|uniref:Uncharacterized protein n=1 Tax=Pseudomarimonas arenosa TaxID=2774145 RepID=A0AAW3ZPU6_9GAMM|nr:hypothetical protein [Pseudomarimonas arenosa]MBD8528210.1 hypothetical protein [Pseudomarimonas arenosa]